MDVFPLYFSCMCSALTALSMRVNCGLNYQDPSTQLGQARRSRRRELPFVGPNEKQPNTQKKKGVPHPLANPINRRTIRSLAQNVAAKPSSRADRYTHQLTVAFFQYSGRDNHGWKKTENPQKQDRQLTRLWWARPRVSDTFSPTGCLKKPARNCTSTYMKLSLCLAKFPKLDRACTLTIP